MPVYVYECPQHHRRDVFLSLADHTPRMQCACGHWADQVITVPLMVTAQPECRYDSPIDGTIIDSWAKRRNDLAKHGCRAYDPEMKTDANRRCQDRERDLNRAVSETVEESIARMPTAKRGQLASELYDQQVEVQYTRETR